MKRNLLILNVALLAIVSLIGWYLREKYLQEQEQEHRIKIAVVRPPAVSPPPALKKVGPLDASTYGDVAVKNLFSPDRNPTPIPDPPPPPPPPKPMPPLPTAHGVMLWEGVPPTVVLSDGHGPQKGYHPGDKIGEFTLVSVNNKEIVFEWDGKQVSKRLDEIMEKNLVAQQDAASGTAAASGAGTSAAAAAAAQTAAAAQQGPQSLSDSTTALTNVNGPGKETGGVRMCNAGDTSPTGAIVDGYQKKVNITPFGVTCRWEPVGR